MIPDRLRGAPVWCVSKDKVPLDMFALARGREWGVNTKRSHPCYVGFEDAAKASKSSGLPVTAWIDPASCPMIVLDIEKDCPAELRRALLLALHGEALYLERSLSGKGYHMILGLPAPAELKVAKYGKWFELLACHHCTFTMREIPFGTAYDDDWPENGIVPKWDADVNPDDLQAKRDHDLLELLSRPIRAMELYDFVGAGKPINVSESLELSEYRAALSGFDGRHADMFNSLCDMVYAKTVDGDFRGDWSSYEFGYASKLHYLLRRVSMDMIDADGKHYECPLTKQEAVMLVFMAMKQCLPARTKHSELRNGLPWLLYTSERVYAKTFE